MEQRAITQMENISSLFLGRIYTILIGMISSIIMVRYLGPANNGIYNYAIAFTTIYSGIGLLGLDNIIIKEFAKGFRSASDIFSASFIIRSIATVAACMAMQITLYILKADKETTVNVWISAIPFF